MNARTKKARRGDTEYLLSSPTNVARLTESIEQYKHWKIKKNMEKMRNISSSNIGINESKFTLLNDIKSNLDFLYEYCGVAASGRAFGMSERQIIELIEDNITKPELYSEAMEDGCMALKYANSKEYGSAPSVIIKPKENSKFGGDTKTIEQSEFETITFFFPTVEVNKDEILQEKGIKITSQTLSELRIFYLADLVLEFIENNKLNLLDRVLKSSEYCHEVLAISHALAVIPHEKRSEAKKKQLSDKNRKNAEKPRLKIEGTGELAYTAAYELFMCWNTNPDMCKNRAAFKTALVDKGYCKNENTAQKWLAKLANNTRLSAGLKVKFKQSQ